MLLYIDEWKEKHLITKYEVSMDLDINTFSVFLYSLDVDKNLIQIEHEEFITYDEVYRFIGQLRLNFQEVNL